MPNCPTGDVVSGTTKAINKAFKVRKRAVQLIPVAPTAAIHRGQDIVRRSWEACRKSVASCTPASRHRRSHRPCRSAVKRACIRSGAKKSAVLNSVASVAMKAYPPAKMVATEPSSQGADSGKNAARPTAKATTGTANRK